MSKELETIKSFQNKRTFDVTYDDGTQKHYETKTIGELFHNEIKKIETKLQNAEKYKKAVEIIKKKKVDVALLFYVDNADMYNKAKQFYNHYKLTQEEYDFLKEIL